MKVNKQKELEAVKRLFEEVNQSVLIFNNEVKDEKLQAKCELFLDYIKVKEAEIKEDLKVSFNQKINIV